MDPPLGEENHSNISDSSEIGNVTGVRETCQPCVSSFQFNQKTYNSCTWEYSNTAWCSTQVDSSGVHVGGTKAICGCKNTPRVESEKPKELIYKAYEDVLKDIIVEDLGINLFAGENDQFPPMEYFLRQTVLI